MESKKEEIYLDLSKLSEEEINSLGLEDLDFLEFSDVELFRLQNPEYMILSFNHGKINISHKDWFLLKDKTEITYPEFIKLFKGGDNDPTAQLQADNEELLEALEKAQNELFQFKEAFGQGSALIPKIEFLIKKHKQ